MLGAPLEMGTPGAGQPGVDGVTASRRSFVAEESVPLEAGATTGCCAKCSDATAGDDCAGAESSLSVVEIGTATRGAATSTISGGEVMEACRGLAEPESATVETSSPEPLPPITGTTSAITATITVAKSANSFMVVYPHTPRHLPRLTVSLKYGKARFARYTSLETAECTTSPHNWGRFASACPALGAQHFRAA